MTDVYVNLAQAEPLVIEQLSQRLELRAADPKQQAMLHAYLTEVPFPDGARVLEVGCGSGAIARTLARWPKVGSVHGIDPSPGLLDRARELAAGISNLDFELGDGRDLPLASESFDVVVFHTCLCHVPGPERALREAHRVLRTGGWMAIFDGDYVTTTVATGPARSAPGVHRGGGRRSRERSVASSATTGPGGQRWIRRVGVPEPQLRADARSDVHAVAGRTRGGEPADCRTDWR